jgi:uroporphyrinogen III methyltransferase / synthase
MTGSHTPLSGLRPLAGKKILLTRPRSSVSRFAMLLRQYGAEPIAMPTIQIDPPASWERLDRAIAMLPTYAWLIFTSVHGVQAFFQRYTLQHQGGAAPAGLRLCAIGPETAAQVRQHGWQVQVIPAEYRAEAVVAALAAFPLQGQRILLPRAAVARDILPRGLTAQGAHVEVVEAYRTGIPAAALLPEVRQFFVQKAIAAITFTSSSTVSNFATLVGDTSLACFLAGVVVACIGPITAATAESYGLKPAIVAQEYTVPALAQAIAEYFAQQEG